MTPCYTCLNPISCILRVFSPAHVILCLGTNITAPMQTHTHNATVPVSIPALSPRLWWGLGVAGRPLGRSEPRLQWAVWGCEALNAGCYVLFKPFQTEYHCVTQTPQSNVLHNLILSEHCLGGRCRYTETMLCLDRSVSKPLEGVVHFQNDKLTISCKRLNYEKTECTDMFEESSYHVNTNLARTTQLSTHLIFTYWAITVACAFAAVNLQMFFTGGQSNWINITSVDWNDLTLHA